MRRTPFALLAFATFVAAVGFVQHLPSRQRRHELERERLRLLADTQGVRASTAELGRQRERELARATAAAARSAAGAPAQLPAAAPKSPLPAATPRPPDAGETRLRVQTFVGEQRMQFAALLHRLSFAPAQRQAFDRIQEEFHTAMLDGNLAASGRELARNARSAALLELFGANHDAWLEANRQQAARAIVDQIVHQTFPSSGALNAAQADELTRIVAQHRLPPSNAGGSGGYDWERIVHDAHTVLADRQLGPFTAAVNFRRASDQMSAMAAQAAASAKRGAATASGR